jgi:hypothetical protein
MKNVAVAVLFIIAIGVGLLIGDSIRARRVDSQAGKLAGSLVRQQMEISTLESVSLLNQLERGRVPEVKQALARRIAGFKAYQKDPANAYDPVIFSRIDELIGESETLRNAIAEQPKGK